MPTRRALLTSLGLGATAAMLGSATLTRNDTPAEATTLYSATDIFDPADWIWGPIPANPVLDSRSSTWASAFARGSHLLNTYEYGVPIYTTHDQLGRRRSGSWQKIRITHTDWGSNPFADFNPIWMPRGAAPSPQSDAAMVIVDPVARISYEFWQLRRDAAGRWICGWGSVMALDGMAKRSTLSIDTGQQGSVGSGVSRRAGLVTRADIAAGVIRHALVLSSDMVAPRAIRFPATKTDGRNLAGVGTPIPEAARIQLHPAADLSGLSGYQRMIARALQVYGAYVIDNGGARAAIIAEGNDPAGPRTGKPYFCSTTPVPGNPVFRGSTFWNAGMRSTGGGYQSLEAIPWHRIRVLRSWNGR